MSTHTGVMAMVSVLMGVLVLIFGLALAPTIVSSTITALTVTGIDSFASASAIGGIIPFVYYSAVVVIGVGLIGTAGIMTVKAYSIVVLPAFIGLLTPYPVAMALIAVVAWGSVVTYKHYMARRRELLNQLPA